MKNKLLFISLLLAVITFFCSCDVSFDIGSSTAPETTAPDVSETGSDTSSATVPVSLSDDDKEKGKDFYTDKEVSDNGISADRVHDSEDESQKSDKEILSSKKYIVTGRMKKDGKITSYRVAQDGDNYAMFCTYNSNQVGMIVDATYFYILMPDSKSYVVISKKDLAQYTEDGEDIDSLLKKSFYDSEQKTVAEGETEIEGQKLHYRKYDDGSVDYTKNDTLIMSKTKEGSIIYYDSISGEVSAGVFKPPVDYTKKALTVDTLSELSEMMGDATTAASEE